PTEGDTVTFKVSLEDLDGVGGLDRHTGVKVTLSNGVVIEIPAGEIEGTKEFTITDKTPGYSKDWTENITIDKVEEFGGVEFEKLEKGDGLQLNVKDTPAKITITGSTVGEEVPGTSTGTKVQGEVTLTLDKKYDHDIEVTIKNQATGEVKVVTIPKDTYSVEVTMDTARVDDVYKQGTTTETITIVSVSDNITIENSSDVITINDDKDPTGVTLNATIIKTSTINTDNIKNNPSFTVTAKDGYDGEADVSVYKTTSVDGFGVLSRGENATGSDGQVYTGNPNELGVHKDDSTKSEKIIVEFNNEIKSMDVAFSWRATAESARVDFYDGEKHIGYAIVSDGGNTNAKVTYYRPDNTILKTEYTPGGSDKIDSAYTFEPGDGTVFDRAEFTAHGADSDYLIHSIDYKEVVQGNSLDKGDKAEVLLEVQTEYKPDPKTFNPANPPIAKVDVNGTIHDVKLDENGYGTLEVTTDGNTDLVAKVTEIIGGNYEAVDTTGAQTGVYVGDIETEKNTNDEITGTKGNDVIVGDEGGTSKKIVDGQNYNIAIIVDKSNSMKASSGTGSMNRMELLKASLNNLADTLANHDGVINLSIIGFGTNADTAIVFNNLTSSDLTALKNSINGLNGYNSDWDSQVGGTNYEAAFNATKAWFDGLSSSNDASYENMTYFLTDGEPTQYGTGQGIGNAYDSTADSKGQIAYNNLVNTHDVKVYAIGIGNDVSVNTLNKYDNTEIEVIDIKTNAQTIETETFSNNGNTLPTGWEHTGLGSAVVSGQKLVITDNNTSNSNFASVKSKTYEIGKDTYGKLSFDYSVSSSDYRNGDKSTIILQKLINGEWEDIGTPQTITTSGSGSYKSQLLSEGEYRLVINVNDTTSSKTYKLSIDNVKLQATSDLDKLEFKKVDIVNTAEDLEAALQGGSTTYDPAKLGSDIITGGAGNDIIFGDTINTDHLTWTGRTLPAGSGTEALKEMIKVQNPGISDEDLAQKMYDYIKENHASLAGDGTKDGNDTITGGEGRDIIYAQGGDDTIITDLNTNDGVEAGDLLIDGGTGFDTIKLEGNNDIDFSKLGDIIKNIEAIDLTEGDHKLTNISLEDVLKMTDSSKELIILRDSEDSVLFKDTIGENGQAQTWSKAENSIVEDGKTFEVYTNSGDESLKVKVEQPISDGITN
ncbi:vWA domain-containing protein, partial [Aliarcobacter cryaerophilus]